MYTELPDALQDASTRSQEWGGPETPRNPIGKVRAEECAEEVAMRWSRALSQAGLHRKRWTVGEVGVRGQIGI